MSRILIIGYGSSLRGDDAAGPVVAERLAESMGVGAASVPAEPDNPADGGPAVEVLSLTQLTPELALSIARFDQVYFIDACPGQPPGTWECKRLDPGEESAAPALAHHCHPAALLVLAKELCQAVPRAWIITIAGTSFPLGQTLSTETEQAVFGVLNLLRSKIAGMAGGASP